NIVRTMPHSLILRKHRISPRLPHLATKTGEKCGLMTTTTEAPFEALLPNALDLVVECFDQVHCRIIG
ncbi:MAG: hypothetical protein DRJ65_16680, partial [Acidobacteria bacterium]